MLPLSAIKISPMIWLFLKKLAAFTIQAAIVSASFKQGIRIESSIS